MGAIEETRYRRGLHLYLLVYRRYRWRYRWRQPDATLWPRGDA